MSYINVEVTKIFLLGIIYDAFKCPCATISPKIGTHKDLAGTDIFLLGIITYIQRSMLKVYYKDLHLSYIFTTTTRLKTEL